MSDLIDRQAAIDAIAYATFSATVSGKRGFQDYKEECKKAFVAIRDEYIKALKALPSAEPDGIPLEWINKHLEWLDNCDNDFAQLTKVNIRTMVASWKKSRT